MKEAIDALRDFCGFIVSLVNQPNALTIISVALLFLVGKHYWKDLNAKIGGCEAKHSRCERRLGIMVRLLHGALEYDTAREASSTEQRSEHRRAADFARAAGMSVLRRTLDDMLREIDSEEKEEEEALITGGHQR